LPSAAKKVRRHWEPVGSRRARPAWVRVPPP
jgi:hypothetical protein